MAFAGMSYLAIAVAAVAGYVFGAAWYMLLSKPWMAASGMTEPEITGAAGQKRGGSPLPFILAFVANVLMAFVLAGVIGHLGPGAVTLKNGIISALFIWGGFVITTLAVNNAFQMRKPMLSVIDGGHWLGVLMIQGAIIGAMGV